MQNLECRWITAGDVGLVAKGLNEPDGSKARAGEMVLADARARLREAGRKKLLESNDLVKVFGRFDVYVARYILDKQESTQPRVFQKLQDICKAFVAELLEVKGAGFEPEDWADFGEKTQAGLVPREGEQAQVSKKLMKAQALHAKATAGTSSKADKKASLPLAEINAEGEVETPIWMIRQKGFDLGSVITYPTTNAAPSVRGTYVITDTNALDSKVHLKALGGTEERLVSAKDLLNLAEPGKAGEVEVVHPRWPSGRCLEQRSVQQTLWAALGQCALHSLSASLTNSVSDQCEMLLKPQRCVRLKVDVAPGALALLPEGKVMFYPKEKAAAQLKSGAVELKLGGNKTSGPSGEEGMVAVPLHGGMESAAPWWFVSITREASDANVELVTYRVNQCGACDPMGPNASMPRTGLAAEEALTTWVNVPVLVNRMALAAGTVLKRFVPKAQDEPKDPKAITVSQVAKRARLNV